MKWTPALKDFEHYLKIERGLSQNTVNSYRIDVQKLMQYLDVHNMPLSPIKINAEAIQQFLYELAKNSNARTHVQRQYHCFQLYLGSTKIQLSTKQGNAMAQSNSMC